MSPPAPSRGPYTPSRGPLRGRAFATTQAYRNALAQAKGFRSRHAQHRGARVVRTAHAAVQLKPAAQDARERALQALSLMRRNRLGLRAAAQRAGTTSAAVQKYAGPALVRGPGGRYTARASDRLFRAMRFLTPTGQVTLHVTDSRTASRIARYWDAVDRYLKTGDDRALRAFRGKAVRVGKVARPFVTDLPTLRRLGSAGEVAFEDLYARAA